MEHLDTPSYELLLTQCESRIEYEALTKEYRKMYVSWKDHIRPMLSQHMLTYKMIAEGCEVSLGTARSFGEKIPARRESVIMLAMMMGLTVDQTDHLLTRWARYQKLYPRNPSDAIWIYLLNQGGSRTPRKIFRQYHAVYNRLKKEYIETGDEKKLDTQVVFGRLTSAAKDWQGDAQFENLIRGLLPSFRDGYRKLLDYIDSFFGDIEDEDNQRLGLERSGSVRRSTPNIVFLDSSWKDAYYRKIRSLAVEQIMPGRSFLIALGLRLSMNVSQMNKLLDLAGMGQLCPKDPFEGMLVFLLEELECLFPSYFHEHQSICSAYDLMDYTAQYDAQRMLADPDAVVFELPDILRDHEDNPSESLYDYVQRYAQEADLGSYGYQDYLHELFPNSSRKKEQKGG